MAKFLMLDDLQISINRPPNNPAPPPERRHMVRCSRDRPQEKIENFIALLLDGTTIVIERRFLDETTQQPKDAE